jgi:hypothetical protein
MDKEAIKNELIREGELIINSTRNPINLVLELVN